MAEENDAIEQTEEPKAEPQPQGDGTDWKAEARKWQTRANNDRKAWQQAEEQLKAQADYADIKAELENLKAEKARAEAVKAAAKEYGVDAEMLARMDGNVEDNAKWLSERPKYAPVHDGGEANSKPLKPSTADLFAQAIHLE